MHIEFPIDYFEEEIRCGFTVPSMMKRAWAAELKVLKIMEDFFDKYDIKYYIEYGTLLGAVRHQGFIPWDDDIDIAMLRPDFMRMIEHAEELPAPFKILSIYNSNTYYTHNGLATNNRAPKLEWDEERIRDFYGCPYIINIDINPLDVIPRDEGQRDLQQKLYYFGYSLTRQIVNIETLQEQGQEPGEEAYAQFEKEYTYFTDFLRKFFGDAIKIDEDRPLRNELCRVSDMIAGLFKWEDGDMLDYYPHMVYSTQGPFRKKEWYAGEQADLPFETTTLKASASYKEQIIAFFGENYMTPVQNTQAHDYPFYKKQEEYFRFMGHEV